MTSFENISVDLKKQAYENQIEQLILAEGANSKLETRLRAELSKVST
jgi:hypothetical protein